MEKYLREYAERGTAAVRDIPAAEPWRQVVVIPVCNESTQILRSLPPAPGRSLMILVVNEPETAARPVSAANRAFAAEVRARFRMCWQSAADAGLSLYTDPGSPRDVLLVDRFSEGRRFPPKGGVGHARKTGADLAAFLVQQRRVCSPWIHCSDADVQLPPRYFTSVATLEDGAARDTAALIYPFRHGLATAQSGDKLNQLTRLYEFSLRYYVAGLAYAASPYAFHTIGSTITVNAVHYARVRGFPRRQAGEDFYLLNKLAKVGSVKQLEADSDCEPIQIAVRRSDRVPFGTGAAVGKLMELEDPAREFRLYHPAVFELLRTWHDSLPALWESRCIDVKSELGSDPLIDALGELRVSEALQHALRQSSHAGQFIRQMHTWFDAFRTLKLIHFLRDSLFPSISFAELLTKHSLDYLEGYEPVLRDLREWLEKEPGWNFE